MSWDGQIGERRPHAPHHSRWSSSVSKQLVDPFKHSWFRHDARKASSWFQTSIVNFATPQEPRGYSLLPKVAKLFLILVELVRILVAFFFWASPRRWTRPWLIRETWWTVIGPILRINLVQNYSSKFGNSQQQFTVTDGRCKHYTSNTARFFEKWQWRKQRLRWKLWEQVCDELQHFHELQLEQHAQQAAHNAQQVHQWRRWLRRLRGAHHALSLHIARTVPHLMMTPHTSWLKFWAITLSSPYHPWRVLFDSTSPFFLYFSFLPFSVYFLYHELFLELDNPIVLASLRYFPQISLVFTEQSQTCVKNMNPFTIDQGNLIWWWDNQLFSVKSRQKFLWRMMTQHIKTFYCSDMKSELKVFHRLTEWVNFVWMQDL